MRQEWRLEPVVDETGPHYEYVAIPPKADRHYVGGILVPIEEGPPKAPPPPLVCDCGHPDGVHDKTPGVGCTHRPYCLCVHPTGQRVPHTRVRL